MARRVKQTSSRGSKVQHSQRLSGDVKGRSPADSIDEEQTNHRCKVVGNLFSTVADDELAIAQCDREEAWTADHIDATPIIEARATDLEPQRLSNGFLSPLESSDSDCISPDDFDEAGYLRLNPDVRSAIESGQFASGYVHYCWHGKAEGRAVPDTFSETRNVILASAYDRARDHIFAQPARCSIDELVIAPTAGLMIVGWIDDASDPLSCIRVVGRDWRVVIDASRFFRVRRGDVENTYDGRAHAFGFIGFLHFEQGGEGSGPIRVELSQAGGSSTSLHCGPTLVEDVELRDKVLAALASAAFFGSSSIESMSYLSRGVGAELVRFNKSVTRRIVAEPYVERFGLPKRSPRGSIIVCLYGKPEFFFVQNCLFAGLPGIEDYEFVYVSNSPEMAETLLREAQCASLIYGLAVTVVILSGNAGFGAANNVGARIALSDRLLVVNPDVFPRDRNWAKKHTELLSAVPAEQSRLFGVPLYYDDGSLMHGGMYFEVDVGVSLASGRASPVRICRTQHYGKGAPAKSLQFNRPRPVPAVTGAFMSIDRSWYEQLEGFTEDFIFGHYEDADLCLKSLSRGAPPWLHDIRLWHLEGKGSTRSAPHEGGSIVNRWLFSTRWMSSIDAGLIGPEPTHPLMQNAGTTPFESDRHGKRRIVRQRGRVG